MGLRTGNNNGRISLFVRGDALKWILRCWVGVLLFTLGVPTSANASIGFVQVADQNPEFASTVSVTLPAAQGPGNLNVVFIGWDISAASIQSVSDTNGNTYIAAVGPALPSGPSQMIFYAKNVGAGSNTVIVTFSATVSWPDVRVIEYSGIDPTNSFDAGVSGSGVGTAMSSGSLTTTNGNDLLVASNYIADYSNGIDSGYTQRIYTEGGEIVEDRIVTAVGTYSASATQGAAGWWLMQLAGFRAAGSGGGGDAQAPTAPSGVTAQATSGTEVSLSWIASSDNVGVTGYFLERCQGANCTSFAQIGTPLTTTFIDSAVVPSATYTYRVRATDAAGNLSAYSNTAGAVTNSIAFVQGADQNPVSAGTVSVTLPAAQGAGDLNVVLVGWDSGSASIQSISDTNGNTYIAAVEPVSINGHAHLIFYAKNVVAGSNTVTVTFSATTSWPDVAVVEYSGIDRTNPFDGGASSSGIGSVMSSGSLTTTNANDLLVAGNYIADYTNGIGPGYVQRIYSDGGEIVEDRMVTAVGTYSASATQGAADWWLMQLAAFRSAGSSGGSSDTQVPTAPTSLATSAISSSEIDLSWTASTDNVGVTGYAVERCAGAECTNFTQIATVVGTTFSDMGLSADTSYAYRVRATDSSGNFSAYSSLASATTLDNGGGGGGGDSNPPTTPAGLSATAVSGSAIQLRWTASTDDVGVTAYLIERCQGPACSSFAQVATSNATTYTDSGLTASTAFSYRVRAKDAAGNLGDYSGVAAATTLANGAICD